MGFCGKFALKKKRNRKLKSSVPKSFVQTIFICCHRAEVQSCPFLGYKRRARRRFRWSRRAFVWSSQSNRKAVQMFQQKPIEQVSYNLSKTNSGTRLNNGYPLFAFAMLQPIFAFQTFDLLDGTGPRGGPEYSWVCVAACITIVCGGGSNPACVNNCLSSCIVN